MDTWIPCACTPIIGLRSFIIIENEKGCSIRMNILNEQEYYRIVYGGWLGKNIGGTLGAPVEGVKELMSLTFYPELPDGPLENDDLDLQLVWLHALEQYGPGVTAEQLGQEWLTHIFFPFDEYGYALTNLRRGLIPPLSGSFNNPFNHCMGSPIRSEIWAMITPGLPEKAAFYAYQDAIVDHAGGEGVYGEMFFAAIESAIFREKNRDLLIEIGLKHIPTHSRTYRAVKDLICWHQQGKTWIESRSLILKNHGNDNFTDAPQNVAFTILGWLYGHDFEDAILKAVNCGYDTDCTAATLGAILGMLLGADGLPERWANPVGTRVVVSPPIKGFPAPKNLDELTLRTIRVGKQVLAAADADIVVLPHLSSSWDEMKYSLAEVETMWGKSEAVNHYLLPRGTLQYPELELIIEYGSQGPAIGANQTKTLHFTLFNRSFTAWTGQLSLELEKGWKEPCAIDIVLQPNESMVWSPEIQAPASLADYHELAFVLARVHDHSIWTKEKVRFSLVSASCWMLSGPDSSNEVATYFSGNCIEWDKAIKTDSEGCYHARTKLYNPSDREVILIAAANVPVSLKLNGKILINCEETLEFMPAYHRAPKEQQIELLLTAGTYEIEIEAYKDKISPKVFILPVATAKTAEPGPYYYYKDMLFGIL